MSEDYRWTNRHNWKFDSSVPVLATLPPRYTYYCTRCGERVTTSGTPSTIDCKPKVPSQI